MFSLIFLLSLNTYAQDLPQLCENSLKALPGRSNPEQLKAACAQVKQLPECVSHEGVPIYHMDYIAKQDKPARKILTIALIHGDEGPAGSVARSWMERLTKIEPRNSWRIVPILNPDGVKRKTRTNANGVDINRNFPTTNWEKEALTYWKRKTRSDPRRYPGATASSEKETKCAIKHIEEFAPNFIISIHTPYAVLDFDGPKIALPRFKELPWISLGNFPGSLGRYMWADRKQPVLTVELKGDGAAEKLDSFDALQDISGKLAIDSEKKIQETSRGSAESKK